MTPIFPVNTPVDIVIIGLSIKWSRSSLKGRSYPNSHLE